MTDDGCTPSKTWSTSLPPKRCEGLFQSCIESVYVNEFDCLRNVSHIWLRTTLSDFQQALKDKYLTYVSDLNYFGNDALQIWISDQGYTSDRYDSKQTASFSLPISVVPINNPPQVLPASTLNSVLAYQRGVNCRTSYMDFAGTQGTDCRYPDTSKMPPLGQPPLLFADVDMDSITPSCPATCGNISLILTFDRPNTGALRFYPILPMLSFTEFINDKQQRVLVIKGKMRDLNEQMNSIYFDVDDLYTGYAPVLLIANDHLNYGMCDRDMVCARYNEEGIQTTPCERKNRMPCKSPQPGIGKVTIDFVIGSQQRCKYETCEVCNRDKECGWCPTTCGGRGKCMIKAGSGPKFEICAAGVAWINTSHEQNVSLGSAFRLCEPAKLNVPVLIGGSVGGFLCLAYCLYWSIGRLLRRYGSLWMYVKKKQFNLTYTGRKLHLLPPPGADYAGAFIIFLVPLLAGLFLSGALVWGDSPYHFKNGFYLDETQKLTMRLDNCHVRFLPKRNMPAPDNQLEAIKIRFAYPAHPQISLSSETCGPNQYMEILNSKPAESKYLNYWCSVEIITPERYVLPQLHIIAKGDNVTSIRGGPMDADTLNYGLDFGPNALIIEGNYVDVRLQNVTMKHFEYKVRHGSLLAVDMGSRIGSVPTATMHSHDADMIVTTRRQTSVQTWQRSDDFVCLTAANNSMFIDSNCQEVCSFIKPPEQVDEKIDITVLVEDSESPCPDLPEPLVDGCYNASDCTLVSTQRCFCKPTCEYPYADVNGTCTEDGKCCREECSGFTFADLFPVPDMPRCGACIDTIAMPWTPGNLEQKWQMKSETGQISLQVLNDATLPSVSSHKLDLEPKKTVEVNIDLSEDTKRVLDSEFHPGGGSKPLQPIFGVLVQGLGAPERASFGYFAWIENIRYLVIPDWIMSLFSLQLLAPATKMSKVALRPGFCPGYIETDTDEFSARIVKMYLTIKKAMEEYPPGKVRKLPYGSSLYLLPVKGAANSFSLDVETNQFTLKKVMASDYGDMMVAFYVSLALPLVLAVALAVWGSLRLRALVLAFRVRKCYEEAVLEDLPSCVRLSRGAADDRLALLESIEVAAGNKAAEMSQRTSPFYLLHAAFGLTSQALNLTMTSLCLARDIIVVAAPVVFPVYLGMLVKDSLVTARCATRLDMYVCLAEPEWISLSTFYVCLLYSLVAVAELAAHYLMLPYDRVPPPSHTPCPAPSYLRAITRLLLRLLLAPACLPTCFT